MIIITGGAGFIGSNYARFLNKLGYSKIIIVDNFSNGKKIKNIADIQLYDVIQKENLFNSEWLNKSKKHIQKIIHLGACSSTQEWDGKYLLENNFEYSKYLFNFALENKIDFLYASSASVYGLGDKGYKENTSNLKPINAYAYSKYIFDQYFLTKSSLIPSLLF